VSIRRQYVELSEQLILGPPKSRAGTRTVGIPAASVPELRDHPAAYVGPQPDDLAFTGPLGGVLRGQFRTGRMTTTGWAPSWSRQVMAR
jgi:hypothetical protein